MSAPPPLTTSGGTDSLIRFIKPDQAMLLAAEPMSSMNVAFNSTLDVHHEVGINRLAAISTDTEDDFGAPPVPSAAQNGAASYEGP